MRSALIFIVLLPVITFVSKFEAQAAPAGPLIKHLSSLVKWTRASSKTPHQSDVGNVLQFEDGYLVETVVEGNELGFVPHSIRVSQDGELFAVDAVNSNIVRITPPLSQYSRARLVAGSFQGRTGHVDGKPSDARFSHPKGVTMDDKGNVYVADTSNLAIRKIGEAGVTTIAGGKLNVAGYRDGPSEYAKFSTDFDVVYVRPACSLLVVDRGNAALRQISLSKEDCDYEITSFSPTDLLMMAGAILIGYVSCLLQQGLGSSFFPNMKGFPQSKFNEAVWPSFGQLIRDLPKVAMEALSGVLAHFIPSSFINNIPRRGLTPLKYSLVMPEDEAEPAPPLKQRTPAPLSETRQVSERPDEAKLHKLRSTSTKDPSLSTKHRSSRRQEYAEFYGSSEAPQHGQVRPKSQKERSKHRHRERGGDATFGAAPVVETKPGEAKPAGYQNTKYDPYSFRGKHGGDSYRFD